MGDGSPWWLRALIVLPALLWAPGDGWARWLCSNKRGTSLQILIDGAWIGLALAWLSVSLTREMGLTGHDAIQTWWGLALASAVAGQWLSRRSGVARHTPRRELIGVGGVLLSLLGLVTGRAADLSRTLDGYWYLDGADTLEQTTLNMQPDQGWESSQVLGDPEFGRLKGRMWPSIWSTRCSHRLE